MVEIFFSGSGEGSGVSGPDHSTARNDVQIVPIRESNDHFGSRAISRRSAQRSHRRVDLVPEADDALWEYDDGSTRSELAAAGSLVQGLGGAQGEGLDRQ